VTATGDASFKNKAAAAFRAKANSAGLIMAAHGESTLRRFCQAGIFLHEGKAHWFDDINEALARYHESISA
jgi:capsular polysaccharide transport system ATP-binding protein